jgi:hypothetical protein
MDTSEGSLWDEEQCDHPSVRQIRLRGGVVHGGVEFNFATIFLSMTTIASSPIILMPQQSAGTIDKKLKYIADSQ